MRNAVQFSFLLLFLSLFDVTVAHSRGLERYQVILERRPFGKGVPEPEPVGEKEVAKPIPQIAQHLRLRALLRISDRPFAGLEDLREKRSFLMQLGDMKEELELVEIDYEQDRIVLKQDAYSAELLLESDEVKTAERKEPSRRQEPEPSETNVDKPGQNHQKHPKSRYDGHQLNKLLEEYNREIIRKGMPPIPVPAPKKLEDPVSSEF